MKTKFYFSAACLLAASSLLFMSCEKDDKTDVTKPVIKLNAPKEGEALKIGDEHGVHFDMDLSDDVMLKSYQIDVHNNFDNHSHTKSDDGTEAFAFKRSYDVSGKKETHIHHHDIKIPANATPGKYHLMVHCLDAAGNESFIERNVVLSKDAKGHEHHHHHKH